MQRDEIRAALRTIFEEEIDKSLPEMPDDVKLAADFDLDSLDMVGLVMQVERHFHIRLSHEELAHAVTAGDLIDLVQAKVNAQAKAA